MATTYTRMPPEDPGLSTVNKIQVTRHPAGHCHVIHCEFHRRGHIYRACVLATEEVAPFIIYGPYEFIRHIAQLEQGNKRVFCEWADGITNNIVVQKGDAIPWWTEWSPRRITKIEASELGIERSWSLHD